MGRTRIDDDDGVAARVPLLSAWERKPVANEVRKLLDSLEIEAIDREARSTLQRWIYRADKYSIGDRGTIILALRAITESEGNGPDALLDPILRAVHSSCRPQWTGLGVGFIAGFDAVDLKGLLDRMVGLKCFDRYSLYQHYALALRGRLWEIFGPDIAPEPVKVKPPAKLPLAVTRIPEIERRIAVGAEMLALRSAIQCNKEFGRLRSQRFDMDAQTASEAIRVAKIYAARPEIFRSASWQILCELSSHFLSPDARRALEDRIIRGEKIKANEIRRQRGVVKPGAPKRSQERPAVPMAA